MDCRLELIVPMKITAVVGARPQFIKSAIVSRAFREHRSDVREVIVYTGQHYDTTDAGQSIIKNL